ncbi:extracellular alkaline serine protease [Colletotrichum scovillei]|uniref:Extracellular alkaline serine protease n=1 Tax=Colletotrichum scovillei TaxID=1209932 RepID=A0A9P7U6P6_9PEZI|nr:extracellular alkaline serine protease [Colletotrichum scovillei]KAG7049030.1 extracellular alkaline serine protease [Colletotrichum scovillei]KAG7063774.1 extracellular alkaline serine protease [Colletotrichum scovillei]
MEFNRSSRFTGLLQSVKKNLPLYSSWAQSSSDLIAAHNQAHLLAWDLEFHERDIGSSQLDGGDTGPESWLEVAISSAEMGRIHELNTHQVAELLQPYLDKIESGDTSTPDASLPFGTNSRPSLLEQDHVDKCLAEASKHLFKALTILSSCCDGQHIARIQLSDFLAAKASQDDRSFGLFLSSDNDITKCVWREMTCGVTRGQSSGVLPSQDTLDLCRLLPESEELGRPLGLSLDIRSGSFLILPYGLLSTERELDSPRVCLGKLLDNRALAGCPPGGHYTSADKATLCLNLALGMLHLSAEAWLQTPWNVDNIYFTMNGLPASRDPDITLPFLSRTIERAYSTSTRGSESLPEARSPVLAFAQVIAEICLGKRLPPKSHANDSNLRKTLDDFTQAPDTRKTQHLDVLGAISACISFYVNQRSNRRRNNIPSQNPDAKWIFYYVVRRLEKALACFSPSIDNRRCFELEYYKIETVSEAKARSEASPTTSRQPNGITMNKSLHTTEKVWFDKVRDLNDVFDSAAEFGRYPKVKIAVLDTGIDPEYQNVDGIKDYIDFVDLESQFKIDTTGHGTSVVDLIYRVYAHAEIYVARVFESTNATSRTPHRVNKIGL